MTIETAAALLSGQGAPPPPAPPAEQSAAAPPPSGQAPAAPWYGAIRDESVRNWMEGKSFADPSALAESAYNLEKLIGHEKAGRTAVVPNADAPPEEWKAFHAKLGVPDKPDGYKLPVPEGQSGEFAKEAANWFHELGVPPRQAEALAAKWNDFSSKAQARQAEALAAQGERDVQALQGEWGAAYGKNLELARRAAAQFLPAHGDAERAVLLEKIEGAIGAGPLLRLFAGMGQGLGEHVLHRSGEASGQFGALTPGQARARIETLRSDRDWVAKYLEGDKAKIAEMQSLHGFAYPAEG